MSTVWSDPGTRTAPPTKAEGIVGEKLRSGMLLRYFSMKNRQSGVVWGLSKSLCELTHSSDLKKDWISHRGSLINKNPKCFHPTIELVISLWRSRAIVHTTNYSLRIFCERKKRSCFCNNCCCFKVDQASIGYCCWA